RCTAVVSICPMGTWPTLASATEVTLAGRIAEAMPSGRLPPRPATAECRVVAAYRGGPPGPSSRSGLVRARASCPDGPALLVDVLVDHLPVPHDDPQQRRDVPLAIADLDVAGA